MNLNELGELRSSNDAFEDAPTFRQRFEQDGYLLLRDWLDTDAVQRVRRDVVAACHASGWLASAAIEGAAVIATTPKFEGQVEFLDAYDRVQRLETFHALAHDQKLIGALSRLHGGPAFPHPLKVARLVFPDAPTAVTPAHQDHPATHGTRELYTSWIPLGDCPRALGGLAILEGSHRHGVLPVGFAKGPGNRRAMLPEAMNNLRWLSTDFRAGDVLIFHSLTVHRALPNTSTDELRLSVDYRYQREGDALTAQSLAPHLTTTTWEEIYAGWTSTKYQYYWRHHQYEVVPEDPRLIGFSPGGEPTPQDVLEFQRDFPDLYRRLTGATGGAGAGTKPKPG